eukprot:TRINITY_DN8953_c0_g1_i2.p1 TRINITY_DN8953_c0_g1~~TRINITY_DN8953_c0_g1_i2.p1  ORF type:complete len:383 (+),score=38.44 TRINITY_DN8953_c0_g1_i2:56-1204(+)
MMASIELDESLSDSEPLDDSNDGRTSSEILDSSQMLQRIQRFVLDFLTFLNNDEIPVIEMASRASANRIETDDAVLMGSASSKRSLCSKHAKSQSNVFLKFFVVLETITRLLKDGRNATQRDIYYSHISIFSSQDEANAIIRDISMTMRVPRHCLHIIAMSRGVIGGCVQMKVNGLTVNCKKVCSGGMPIPGDVFNQTIQCESDARYIIVIEKDGIFERLMEDRFFEQVPAILITAKGFPDMATRWMLRFLSDTLKIPVFGLVDFNPFGLAILLTYRLGSHASALESLRYNVEVKWLGLHSADIVRLDLPSTCHQELTARDRKTIDRLLASKFISEHQDYADELRFMLEKNIKCELQAIHCKGYGYLSGTYVRQKLLHHQYM